MLGGMKIQNETTVVTTSAEGETIERKADDPNFQVGRTYPIPELGPGLWEVTAVEPTGTRYAGRTSVTTTRVTVTKSDETEAGSLTAKGETASGSHERFAPNPFAKPVPKPTQRTRRQPK